MKSLLLWIGVIGSTFYEAPNLLASSRAGNGGDVIIAQDDGDRSQKRLYSLDLVEYGQTMAKFLNINTLGWFNPLHNTELPSGYVYHRIAKWKPRYDQAESLWIIDMPDKSLFNSVRDAAPEIFSDDAEDADIDHYALDRKERMDKVRLLVLFTHLLFKISQVEPEYADLVLEKLRQLEWVFVIGELEEVRDENTPISLNIVFQIARNDEGIVRISKHPFFNALERTKPNSTELEVILPPNNSNQLAIITHEILYALRMERGDTNSKVARKANAYLFTNDSTGDAIRKSYELILKPSDSIGSSQ